jgi:hypothetical protein
MKIANIAFSQVSGVGYSTIEYIPTTQINLNYIIAHTKNNSEFAICNYFSTMVFIFIYANKHYG